MTCEKLVTGISGGVCGVYAITSLSGKRYIGSSIDIRRRWYEHHWRMKNGKSSSPQLDRAFAKYGLSLSFDVLEECSPDSLRDREQHYLNALRPEFNVSHDAYCAANWACKLGAARSGGAEARRCAVEDSNAVFYPSISEAAKAYGCSKSAMRRRVSNHDPMPCGLRFKRQSDEWKPIGPNAHERKVIGIWKSFAERKAKGLMGHSQKAKREKSERTKGVPWSDERKARFYAKKKGSA